MRVFTSLEDLRRAQGSVLGISGWLTVDQGRVDRFAEATGDHQWIHVDAERAATGPFGTTIAHGYLTLSLLPYFAAQNYRIEGARMSVNYGLNKVRFISPVRVGSRLRGVSELVDVADLNTGAQLAFRTTIELEGSPKPACVVESLSRQYF